MKLKDLEGRSREEQSQLIATQPKVSCLEMIDNPNKMQGKILVFRGNYAGFSTKGLCIRKLEYRKETGRWRVSDIDLSDMFVEDYAYEFSGNEMLKNFQAESNSDGFLLDK